MQAMGSLPEIECYYYLTTLFFNFLENHHQNIIRSLDFLSDLVNRRLSVFFNTGDWPAFSLPDISLVPGESHLCDLVHKLKLSTEEFALVIMALAPGIQPSFFDNIIQKYLPNGGDFVEIGGAKGVNHRGMLPTGETARFLLAGDDLEKRLQVQQMLMGDSTAIRQQVISIEPVKDGEPVMSGRLMLSEEWHDKILFEKNEAPRFTPDFPARRITTAMEWEDLVLSSGTLSQINDIAIWMKYNEVLGQDNVLSRRIKPGYRVLFYGPPGTGKTLTATLLGKQFKKDVYRIDLSQVVSKYIGETEKNLEKVFAKAEYKDWILFFDEADALFGKRTGVQSSHDRYANQEVSYLLQRVEDYNGLLILASNFKSNMDDAFLRRFHTIVHFPAPNATERLQLWRNTLPANYAIEPGPVVEELSGKYELNGAGILNVVHYACLKSIACGDRYIRKSDLIEAIRKEFRKEERSMK